MTVLEVLSIELDTYQILEVTARAFPSEWKTAKCRFSLQVAPTQAAVA